MNHDYCTNCGKHGHAYHQCKHPITSIGIIAFRYKYDELQYLMIRRKDTLGFVDFMRGKYPICNKSHLMNIINEMTLTEKRNLLYISFDELWGNLWGEVMGIQYRSEKRISKKKYDLLREGIKQNGDVYTLKSLIENSTSKWDEPEWGYPKGRRNYHEKDIKCAIREFNEETGYGSFSLKVIRNLVPFEETFTGSNYKSYKHRYYVASINSETKPNSPYQNSEVSCVQWKSYENALSSIRSYNLEKKEVLEHVNKVINKYSLYQ